MRLPRLLVKSTLLPATMCATPGFLQAWRAAQHSARPQHTSMSTADLIGLFRCLLLYTLMIMLSLTSWFAGHKAVDAMRHARATGGMVHAQVTASQYLHTPTHLLQY